MSRAPSLRSAAIHARRLLKRDRKVIFDCHKDSDGAVRNEPALDWIKDYDVAIDKLNRALAQKELLL